MANATLDHLAFPSFDAEATHRFYTEVMGLSLVRAMSGISAQWRRPYLLFAYALGNGTTLGFFEFDGIERPESDGLPRDIRHVGLSVSSAAEFDQWLVKFERCGVEYAIERHIDGRHAFFCDPNGVMFEITVEAQDPPASKRKIAPQKVLDQWIDARKQRQNV
jgi:catechol 2,3-dioxygenase-like lactoylglutathione lyase family enzyme